MLDSKSLPEIVYGSADSAIAKQISTLVKKGLLKKIAAKIYTSNLLEPAEVILKRNLFGVLGKLYPGAVLSFRSALEVWPSPGGIMYLSYTYTKNIELPGITVALIEGPAALETDRVPLAMLRSGVELFNYSNEGVASWYDFARTVITISDISCDIKPILTKDYPLPAPRPCFSVLNKSKIKEAYKIKIPYWSDSVKDCIQRLG